MRQLDEFFLKRSPTKNPQLGQRKMSWGRTTQWCVLRIFFHPKVERGAEEEIRKEWNKSIIESLVEILSKLQFFILFLVRLFWIACVHHPTGRVDTVLSPIPQALSMRWVFLNSKHQNLRKRPKQPIRISCGLTSPIFSAQWLRRTIPPYIFLDDPWCVDAHPLRWALYRQATPWGNTRTWCAEPIFGCWRRPILPRYKDLPGLWFNVGYGDTVGQVMGKKRGKDQTQLQDSTLELCLVNFHIVDLDTKTATTAFVGWHTPNKENADLDVHSWKVPLQARYLIVSLTPLWKQTTKYHNLQFLLQDATFKW